MREALLHRPRREQVAQHRRDGREGDDLLLGDPLGESAEPAAPDLVADERAVEDEEAPDQLLDVADRSGGDRAGAGRGRGAERVERGELRLHLRARDHDALRRPGRSRREDDRDELVARAVDRGRSGVGTEPQRVRDRDRQADPPVAGDVAEHDCGIDLGGDRLNPGRWRGRVDRHGDQPGSLDPEEPNRQLVRAVGAERHACAPFEILGQPPREAVGLLVELAVADAPLVDLERDRVGPGRGELAQREGARGCAWVQAGHRCVLQLSVP